MPTELRDAIERATERLERFCSHPGRYDRQQVHAGFDLTYGDLRELLRISPAMKGDAYEEALLWAETHDPWLVDQIRERARSAKEG